MSLQRIARPALVASFALVLVAAAALAAGPGGAAAWIDQPLGGSTLPFGPTPVTVHATHPEGVPTVRLFVDGASVADLPAPAGDLVTVEWTWTPPAPGTYVLTALAVGADGTPSAPVAVAVTFVGGSGPSPTPAVTPSPTPSKPGATTAPTATPRGTPGPTATPRPTPTPTPRPTSTPRPTATPTPRPTPTPTPRPTPTPTPRPTPTPTPRPTPTPCTPADPVLLVPGNGERIDGPTPLFEWYVDSPGCAPTSIRIQVSASRDFSSIVQQATLGGSETTWTADPGLDACTTYSWRVQARSGSGAWSATSLTWTFEIRGRACP